MAYLKGTLLTLSTTLLLSACAIWPSYFDTNEQAKIADIILLSQDDSVCGTPQAQQRANDVDHAAQWLKIYSPSLPNNEKIVAMTKNLAGITHDFKESYKKEQPPSKFFCQAKLKTINMATVKMLEVSGRRPRP